MISPVSDFVLAIGVLELELCTVHLAFCMGSGVRLRLLGFHGKCFYSLSCFHNLYLLFFILFLLLFSYLFRLSLSLSLCLYVSSLLSDHPEDSFVGFVFPPCGFQALYLDCQTWQKGYLLSEPLHAHFIFCVCVCFFLNSLSNLFSHSLSHNRQKCI